MIISPQDTKNIEELGVSLPLERQKILSILSDKKWFKQTDFELKKELLTLPDDWAGYLSDLSKRKDEIGGLEVMKMISIQRGDFVALTRFKVRVMATNEVIDYGEYETSKYGSNPGFRGILLLEIAGELKYFILKKSEKFAVGSLVYDSLGGMIKFENGELVNMPKRIEDEIKRQLGLSELEIKRFIDLGQMHTDVGRSSNHISLFAAVIDANKAKNIKDLEDKLFTKTKRVSFKVVVEPIDKLSQYINKVDDSFFLACVARLISQNIIKLH